ncbi:unnamed protein product [Acanthoscelides obtectus]|uniref:Uncharacterized protein n=1 Tax=Acanthoscelides obtectus TaxID=200917 RepID=A0A9P0PB90_ACAOB|nr:unnamed protein product [Acanthoscelides obtectus]CAK1675545.1 hypothetical protein AOBTE_LOCUS30291 [Acanthoscelides obtectus]
MKGSPTGNNPSCFAEAKSLPTLSKAQDVNIQAIDLTLLQLEERFSDNDDLLMAISSIEEFDLIKLQPLKKLGKRSFKIT